ncbi:MAG: S-adenosylmethionine decarboxylase [Pseudomonadota bacterium]
MPEARLRAYMIDVCAHLGLRAYAEPMIYAPADGMGKDENAGYDAFMSLIDSGISAYIWKNRAFFSILLYTCKDFDETAAVAFTRKAMECDGEIETAAF